MCPNRSGATNVICVIEEEKMVNKILIYISLWERKAGPPLKTASLDPGIRIDTSDSQVPSASIIFDVILNILARYIPHDFQKRGFDTQVYSD